MGVGYGLCYDGAIRGLQHDVFTRYRSIIWVCVAGVNSRAGMPWRCDTTKEFV